MTTADFLVLVTKKKSKWIKIKRLKFAFDKYEAFLNQQPTEVSSSPWAAANTAPVVNM